MTKSEVFNRLNCLKWETLFPQLILYAEWKIGRLSWRTKNKQPPGGLDANDIVKDAVAAVYSGDRKWNPDSNPDALRYFKSVIDSIVNHLVKSSDHVSRVTATQSNEDDELSELDGIEKVTPFDFAVAENLITFLKKEVKGDEILEMIVLCLADGIYKSEDMADKLNLDDNEVYNARKRLRKIAKRYAQKN